VKLSLVVSVEETAFDAVAVRGGWEPAVVHLARLGYDGVELAIRDPAAVDVGRVEAVVGEAALAVPALGTGQAYLRDGLSLSSRDSQVRRRAGERLLSHVEAARRLGSLVIIGLIRGRLEDGYEATARRFLEGLKPVLDAAASAGVRLVVEPINRYESDFLCMVEDALELIEASGAAHLGVLADTFHMNIEEVSIERAIERAAPRLWHVHAADSNRWAPGFGHLDFGAIHVTLARLNYAGYLSAEVLPKPTPEEAARQMLRTLRPLVGRGDGQDRVTLREGPTGGTRGT
jgi:sugar phosphate isomerase/epimerase